MIKRYSPILFLLMLLASCANQQPVKSISFYHWKADATYPETYQQALKTAHTKKIYLHFFDIESVHAANWNSDGVFPTYVLKSVAADFKNYEIVPVVYLTNQVLKTEDIYLTDLAENIIKLVNQISQKHFGKPPVQIQMDCDWTESTKNNYFELLRLLQEKFEINATIRLHQIKFAEKTGIPPVKSGTLMLYNVGDLKNKEQNSILESSIVKQYVNGKTTYPLPLHLGLPLFSQTIVFNTENEIKIIRNTEKAVLENDPHFQKIDESNFKVISDTLYKGFFLTKNYQLKLEQIETKEIIESYQLIKRSKLNLNEIIFYHLDETSLSNLNLEEIIDQL